MFTRTTGFLIVPAWLAAMSWLIAHDVWPRIAAENPPPLSVTPWLAEQGEKTQYAIKTAHERIGTIWTTFKIDERSIQREDIIWIERLPAPLAPLRISVDSVFTGDGILDEFTLQLENVDHHFQLHGERFHADFSFTFEGRTIEQQAFKLPLTEAGLVAGAFNPFSQLTTLEVGQRWRMQIFNPMAALTGWGDRFLPMLVEVVRKERFPTPEGPIDCFIVRSGTAEATVDVNGLVRVQEVTLPVIGKFKIVYEHEFDTKGAAAARNLSFSRLKKEMGL